MITVYTDGACIPNPGRGGWGIVAYNSEGDRIYEDWGGQRQTTNNIMELTAIIKALQYLKGQAGVVYSDSQYCINGLNEWRHKWKRNYWRKSKNANSAPVANAEIWQELDALANTSRATFKWVRGHNGNSGNERADELADLGWQSAGLSSEPVRAETAA